MSMAQLRENIDLLDGELVALLARRQGYIERAAVLKTERGQIRDNARIEDVVAKVRAGAGARGLSPAIAETVPGFESVGFYGISAPKGTPPEIVDILNKAIGEVMIDVTPCLAMAAPASAGLESTIVPPDQSVPIAHAIPQAPLRLIAMIRTARWSSSPGDHASTFRRNSAWLTGICFGIPVVPEEATTWHSASPPGWIGPAAGASPGRGRSQEASKPTSPGAAAAPSGFC